MMKVYSPCHHHFFESVANVLFSPYRLEKVLKGISIVLFFTSVMLLVAYGKFNNEFLRITLLVMCLAFTYYSSLHWLIRAISLAIHIFTIVVIETSFMRELILQLACY